MILKVMLAENRHTTWLVAHDQHVPDHWVRRCLSLGEYLVAELDGEPVGFLRFSWFWGTIPYLDMIQILPSYRHSGIGRALFQDWERTMLEKGATLLMTSSVGNEPEPQAWHRQNGFQEAGTISFGYVQSVPEVFFVKDLRSMGDAL